MTTRSRVSRFTAQQAAKVDDENSMINGDKALSDNDNVESGRDIYPIRLQRPKNMIKMRRQKVETKHSIHSTTGNEKHCPETVAWCSRTICQTQLLFIVSMQH